MMIRVGAPPEPGQSYRQRRGVYAVLLKGGQVLVTEQSDPSGPVDIQLPGGGIDPGEAPLAALHREVYEETGWRMALTRRLGAFRRFTYMPDYGYHAEKLCTVFLATPTLRLGPPTEPFHRALWMDPAEALERLGNDGDRLMLARALGMRVSL